MSTKKKQHKKAVHVERSAQMIEMKSIEPPQHEIRTEYDNVKMQELVDSIKALGVLQPILVMPTKKGYEIIAGRRRHKAAKQLGLKEIPAVIVYDVRGKSEVMKLHENIVRENISEFDESLFLQTVMKKHKWTQNDLANGIGRSVAYVSDRLGMLKWPEVLQRALREKKLIFSVGRELSRITDEKVLKEYARHAIESGITSTLAEQWAKEWIRATKGDDAIQVRGKHDVGGVGEYKTQVICVACNAQCDIEDTMTFRLDKKCAKAVGLI